MIRVLVMIAVAGFVLAVASLSAAVAIGGPDVLARGGWALMSDSWPDRHRRWADDDWDIDVDPGRSAGAQVTRTLTWTGGDSLYVHVPAEVRYTQADGPATLTVSGPERAVERLRIEDGHIRGRRRHWRGGKLTIVMTAPGVSHFDLSGANRLVIENYRQDRLSLDLSGATDVKASGETRLLKLDMSGAGQADFADLKTREAEVDISGAGRAKIAPQDRAKLDISGLGSVTLLTRPKSLETDISGAGAIHQEGGSDSPSPSPSRSPSANEPSA